MQRYSHDYTKVSEAESLIYRAQRLMILECYDAARARIIEARQLLQEYLSSDNIIEDEEG